MFNENLKKLRLKKGVSQKAVSDYLNISPQSISKWEKGEALPSVLFLPQLASFLDCEINDFFEQNNDKYDIDMLEQVLLYAIEYIHLGTKTAHEFKEACNKYTNVLDNIQRLEESLKRYQIIKSKHIQGILCCSENKAKTFIEYLIKLEWLEKMESDNSYIVLKNNMDGLRIILGLIAELDDSMIARLKATNK